MKLLSGDEIEFEVRDGRIILYRLDAPAELTPSEAAAFAVALLIEAERLQPGEASRHFKIEVTNTPGPATPPLSVALAFAKNGGGS